MPEKRCEDDDDDDERVAKWPISLGQRVYGDVRRIGTAFRSMNSPELFLSFWKMWVSRVKGEVEWLDLWR